MDEPKKIDQKTGREVITSPPYPGFQWKEGYVMRALTYEETLRTDRTTAGQLLGGDPFEWVPADEVDVIEE